MALMALLALIYLALLRLFTIPSVSHRDLSRLSRLFRIFLQAPLKQAVLQGLKRLRESLLVQSSVPQGRLRVAQDVSPG
jgi:hypothetical protein